MRRSAVAATVALCLALSACGSGADDPIADDLPAPEATAEGTTTRCSDPGDDSTDSSLDITEVTLQKADDEITVTFRQDGYPPQDNEVTWTVGYVSEQGSKTVEHVISQLRADDRSHYEVIAGEKKFPLGDPVRVTQEGVVAKFPAKPVEKLGERVRWYAAVLVDGVDADYCPGGDDIADPLDIRPLVLPDKW